ncbi:GyrI-like domain-containing protein [Flavobacterium psychrotolerans]|uniref:AraC family transcriptional regulator n=1 Tax=Flavobacterium psychrotolerans TaxID=2169410 RepID=A0A2U1JQI7_9FLAO|nr:GyrI-like domain-containing protein [Flavobacterium psychrotolerans]PWA07450.1 AraC family transcriptional regulator [Flavobacterium psychrotolerans]
MLPTLKTFPTTKLIGKNLTFTYAKYRAFELWNGFMPRRKEIQNTIGTELYNVQINPIGFDFGPNEPFVKWAAVAVSTFDFVPEGMETLEIPEGLYAVFNYKGTAADAPPFFRYIYTEWLPNSEYELDNRPHFEILGEKYKNNDPTSEEEIWIPVRKKP